MQIFFFYVTTYCVRYIKKESIFYTILDCFACRLNDFFKYKFYRAFFFRYGILRGKYLAVEVIRCNDESDVMRGTS